MRILHFLIRIIRKILSNIFYSLLASFILSIISTNITLKLDFVEQMLTNLLKIINLENLMIARLIGIIFFFLSFLLIFRKINKDIKKTFYFKKHGGISWFIDKDTGIVEDQLYCPNHHLRLHYRGNGEYYCQKDQSEFWRISASKKRRLYDEVSNLAEKKARNRNI